MAMAMANNNFLFEKKLARSDVEHYKFSWPSVHVDALNEAMKRQPMDLNLTPGHDVEIEVVDEGRRSWTFLWKTRKAGLYLKPTITAGWNEFVRAKGLQPDDSVRFYTNTDPTSPAHFVVHVLRAAPEE